MNKSFDEICIELEMAKAVLQEIAEMKIPFCDAYEVGCLMRTTARDVLDKIK